MEITLELQVTRCRNAAAFLLHPPGKTRALTPLADVPFGLFGCAFASVKIRAATLELTCVCARADLWRVEEPGEASHATAAVRADTRQHVDVGEQAGGSGGEDHQTQGAVCWYAWKMMGNILS